MNLIPSDFYFALASVLSSIIVLALFWIADTVDREPWKTILSSYIAGIGTYLASAGFFFFLTQSLQPLRDSMATSWVVSFMVAIAFQIITCRLVLFQNKKHIDTITDYILHFCAVGIGFETAEKVTTSLAILPWMQYISENLYDSVFLLGKSNPLMLMSLGIAAFFWRARKRVPNRRILAKISALSSITFLCSQAIFYSIPMIKNYTSPHFETTLSDLVVLIAHVSESTSYVIISISLIFAVLFDLQIFNIFLNNMLDVIDKAKDEDVIRKIKSMQNPITLISSGNKILWSITTENQEISCSREEYKYIARQALVHWSNRNDSSNTILKSLAYLKGNN